MTEIAPKSFVALPAPWMRLRSMVLRIDSAGPASALTRTWIAHCGRSASTLPEIDVSEHAE